MTEVFREWTAELGSQDDAENFLWFTARHEAGHAFAGLHLYPPGHVSSISLEKPGEELAGWTHIPSGRRYLLPTAGFRLLDDPVAYRDAVIRAAATSFMAGGEAERLFWMVAERSSPFPESVDEIVAESTRFDREGLRRLLTEVVGVPPQDLDRIEEQGRKDAAKLVEDPQVDWIAEALVDADDGVLTDRELEEVVPHPHPMSAKRLGAMRLTLDVKVRGPRVDFETLCEVLKTPVEVPT